MRLSWNEIRARAAEFARNWAGASYEKGETQSFYNDFFEVFGVKRRSVARYEEHVAKLYDPDLMPPNLRKAHQALDRAVDRLYHPKGFTSERERVEHLFTRYEKMRAPLTAEE